MGSLRQRIEAPLELVLDNFTEVEHTPRTHLFLGYAEETISEVQSHTEATNDSVRVVNKGQQKPIPRLLERLFGIVPGDIFVDEWVTRFSPVHTQYFHYWEDPETGEPRPDQLITTVFFNPVDRHTTDLFTFIEARGPQSDSPWLRRILKPIVRGLVRLEVVLDQRLLESITDKRTELDGRRLGRFDKALAENRKRLKSIYRGDP
jgi:vanillate O-demethylase monooxygenase subunit